MMKEKNSALIGFTGFVGGNLCRQFKFSDLYNSKNIKSIKGKYYDLIACAGARSEMWKINQNPKKDMDEIKSLIKNLEKVKTKKLVLISTIAVYPNPIDVDEDSAVNKKNNAPYGQNRLFLEKFCNNTFNYLIIRLPALFGEGIKKNVIYDLLNNHKIEYIHAESAYQFYDLSWLWKDIQKALKYKLKLVNFATEPTSIKEIARDCFDITFSNKPKDQTPAFYNFKSKHYALFGGKNGYLYDKNTVKKNLRKFVKKKRGSK